MDIFKYMINQKRQKVYAFVLEVYFQKGLPSPILIDLRGRRKDRNIDWLPSAQPLLAIEPATWACWDCQKLICRSYRVNILFWESTTSYPKQTLNLDCFLGNCFYKFYHITQMKITYHGQWFIQMHNILKFISMKKNVTSFSKGKYRPRLKSQN